MKRRVLKKILLLGSGALKIGEAGEFDYSGSQALKALKEEKIKTVLINPNIATVQTSKGMADRIYFLPVAPDFVAQVIKKERPDGVLLGFGGQTALNCGLQLATRGVFKKYGVTVLGTQIETIRITEDRALFRRTLTRLNLDTPKSCAVSSPQDAVRAARTIGYPIIIRAGYSLGGEGSTTASDSEVLLQAAKRALSAAPQILVEEYLQGWKEIEYEVVRDSADNCIAVCNMENMDPMGIHTGESIVVAPSQTLTNHEYHKLRTIATDLIRALGVIGECNVQFALDPRSDAYRIIEVNARLSRSSALASKATGYPLAYIAAKLAIGYTLPELKNSITKVTSACFEPALDYIAVKIPRWDLKKFQNISKRIGSEMKSVGEVMAIDRTFEAALQKAVRMLDIGARGLTANNNFHFRNLEEELTYPTDERIFAIAEAFYQGWTVAEVAAHTAIQPWFLEKIHGIVMRSKEELQKKPLTPERLRLLKGKGFSDAQIAALRNVHENTIRALREKFHIAPRAIQIDTLAGEYPAKTNYLYLSYHSTDHRLYGATPISKKSASAKHRRKIIVLGSGPYKIGSSVEFDWCAVNTVRSLRTRGFETIVINCNPETVSTDYDESDRLYFEELTLERILDIYSIEQPYGVVVSVGGQIPNTLAHGLAQAGIRLLGTSAEFIHCAEDRHKFSSLLHTLKIAQPPWKEVTSLDAVKYFAKRAGYPVLVRPSYVLSGAAMAVAFSETDITRILTHARAANDHPIVVSKFISDAKELEIDAVAQQGRLIAWALTEHVENAGVHSGDATIVLPARKVYRETEECIVEITRTIAQSLNITGPFNIQFLAKAGQVLVIECNLRASRSFPFVSKVLGVNFIELAVRAMLGEPLKSIYIPRPAYVAVKAPQFSFSRLQGADPVLTVEMRSTGEVACFGTCFEEALMKSLLATGFQIPTQRILLSLGGDENKVEFLPYAKELVAMNYQLYATPRTAVFLERYGIATRTLQKYAHGNGESVITQLKRGAIELFINTSDEAFPEHIPDDYRMRRTAADYHVPLITNIQLAKSCVDAMIKLYRNKITLHPWEWSRYVNRGQLTKNKNF